MNPPHDASRATSRERGVTRDRVLVMAVLIAAVAVAGYVHYSMSRVREMLPLELLEQQRDIAAIAHSFAALSHALSHRNADSVPVDMEAARLALRRTHALVRTVRRQYTFDSISGASAAHALVNPAMQDIDRWFNEGLMGHPPSSPVVLELMHARAHEAHDALRELEAQTAATALALLGSESQRLNRVRFSIVCLILALAVLVACVAVLYFRQRSARRRVAISEARLVDSIESAGQAVALFDEDDRLLLCNRGYRDLFRVDLDRDAGVASLPAVMADALDARHILTIDDESEDLAGVYRRFRSGEDSCFEMQWHDGRFFQVCEQRTEERGTICFLADITDLKVAQRRMEYLAVHDALTGLPSRRRFHADLSELLSRSEVSGRQAAVVFLDVDRLKWINDAYGHVAGDLFLKELGLRLGSTLRAGDKVARLGGDEFAFALADLGGPAEASAMARRILALLETPVDVGDETRIRTTVSMGIALYPDDGREASVLMKAADDACTYAKRNGRANVQFFDDRVSARSARRASIEHHLREALEQRHLTLVYQPQVSLTGNGVTGLEALLRWRHPELGDVDPSEFIPVAEESGLGRLLLEFAVDGVCAQLRAWMDGGIATCRVWINVSPRQLADVLGTFSEAVAQHALALEMLGVEITERTFVDDPERAGGMLGEIRAHGLSVAIDDFGVGYSSLGALKDYALDELKIDASFVRDLGSEGQDMEIVRAIVSLSRSLELTVVAEGVETLEQLQVLRARGVDTVQGNIVSRPLTGDDMAAFLAAPGGPAMDGLPAAG